MRSPGPGVATRAAARTASVGWRPPALNLFGPLSGNMGLGVSARSWHRFLLDAGALVHAVDLPDRSGRSVHERGSLPALHGLDEPAPHAVNLFHLSPWDLERLATAGHPAIEVAGRVNAIVPFWELPRVPDDWLAGLSLCDVAVAPTRFIESALRAARPPSEVIHVAQPFEAGEIGARERARWGIEEHAFLVVSSFELATSLERKNPWALCEAFERAFPDRPDARLLLKLNNPRPGCRPSHAIVRLRERCAADPRIRLLEAVLPYRDVLALYATADVYLSLHRAEGLGLGMLEAMSVGTPVVATGWSGNLDYMSADNSLLVPYRMTPVRASPQRAYRPEVVGPDAVWADPDPGAAAAHLRRLADDPALGRSLARRAAADLARRRRRADPTVLFAALERAAGRDGLAIAT